MKKIVFEVCANSLLSGYIAMGEKADRIELCNELEAGGITPSAATIVFAKQYLTIPVFVLIRSRGGDFVYDDSDFTIMREDINVAKNIGADGVVIGLLEPDGRIDIKRTTDMVQYARPMQVTFHRAFDRAKDPLDALEDVIKTGADRILTSGQAPTAFEGREMIKKLVEKAAGRIKIIAGGGINPQNVLEIIEYTGVTEVHASCATKIESEMIYNNGFEIPRDIIQTDPELVRGITNLLKKR